MELIPVITGNLKRVMKKLKGREWAIGHFEEMVRLGGLKLCWFRCGRTLIIADSGARRLPRYQAFLPPGRKGKQVQSIYLWVIEEEGRVRNLGRLSEFERLTGLCVDWLREWVWGREHGSGDEWGRWHGLVGSGKERRHVLGRLAREKLRIRHLRAFAFQRLKLGWWESKTEVVVASALHKDAGYRVYMLKRKGQVMPWLYLRVLPARGTPTRRIYLGSLSRIVVDYYGVALNRRIDEWVDRKLGEREAGFPASV